MAIMKWNTPPGGDQEDRRAHIVGHGDGVSLQHAAFGTLVDGGGQVNTINKDHELATKWSTAPYKGPAVEEMKAAPPQNMYGYRDASRQGMCMANSDTCNAHATKASDLQWCAGHTKKFAKETGE